MTISSAVTMPYSSSLTDSEWEVLEPLLVEILPQKKRTRPSNWTKRDIINGIFYQLKNGCNWEDLPKDLPPYSTVYWHYKQWREAGAIEQLMSDRTSFIIAHRLSTIKNVDTIIVLGKDGILEQGSHEVLMQKDGYYKKIIEENFE